MLYWIFLVGVGQTSFCIISSDNQYCGSSASVTGCTVLMLISSIVVQVIFDHKSLFGINSGVLVFQTVNEPATVGQLCQVLYYTAQSSLNQSIIQMKLFRPESNKTKNLDSNPPKREPPALRNKAVRVLPISNSELDETYLDFSQNNKLRLEQTRPIYTSRGERPVIRENFVATANNKIYHRSNKQNLVGNLNNSFRMRENQDEGENDILKEESDKKLQIQVRPKTGNSDKFQKSIQLGKLPINSKIIKQVRPGSSQSSRTFKRKSTLSDNIHDLQNDQDSSFIKITRRESHSNKNISTYCQRQRTGISSSKGSRDFQHSDQKLDPQFYQLFAP